MVDGGIRNGCLGVHNHLYDYATLVAFRQAPYDHPNTSKRHGTRTSKAVQMTQNWVNGLIFGRLFFGPCYILKIKINHVGFDVGLLGKMCRTKHLCNTKGRGRFF